MDEVCLFLYRSIHDVMCSEATLKRAGIPCGLVPVPTSITNDCGMAVAVAPAAARSALEALVAAGARPVSAYREDSSGRIRRAETDPFPPPGGDA